MTDMRNNGQANSILFEALCCRSAAYPATVFQTCMFGYGNFSSKWARRKKLPYTPGKVTYILEVFLRSPFCFTFLSPYPDFFISKALFFSFFQCRFFYEKPLSFISLSTLAPFQDYG
jgi:hypothetical protein